MSEFRIEYTIQRIAGDGDEFEDIGFGSSGEWGDINSALYSVTSDVQNRSWETGPGMPTPEEAEDDE